MSEETAEPKNAAMNFNTILGALSLGVLSWIGYTTQQTSVAVAVMIDRNSLQDRDLLDLRARVTAVEIAQAAAQANLRNNLRP